MARFHRSFIFSNMITSKRSACKFILAASLFISSSSVFAKPQELKLATSLPSVSPAARQIERMAELVFTESNENLKIVPYFGSQLGGENAAISQIARGRIDMGRFTTASLALQFPQIALAHLPFYFTSTEQRDCVFDNHLFQPVKDILATKNLHMLSWGEVGALHLPGKQGFLSPEDIRGKKVGIVSQKIANAFWKHMGANPVSTQIAEFASSIQTGLIDTSPIPFILYVPAGINKISPIMTKLNLWDSSGVTIINKRLYDNLPEISKAAFEKDFITHPASLKRKEIRDLEASLTEAHIKQGGTVLTPTAEQINLWRESLRGFYSKMAKDLGPDGEAFLAIMEEGKLACGQGG